MPQRDQQKGAVELRVLKSEVGGSRLEKRGAGRTKKKNPELLRPGRRPSKRAFKNGGGLEDELG